MTGQGSPRRWLRAALSALVAGLIGVTGCTGDDGEGPVIVQPGAPGEPAQVLTEGVPAQPAQPHTAADVAFLHAMIAHHDQALRMTDLVPARTERADIARFALRIERSQEAEIARMQDWLEARGELAPATGHDHHGADTMPGMLTEAQFADLAVATGPEFDRRFLELMIYHHEGALVMVADLLASGAGQPAEIFDLITHIDADQRIEIDRMHELLAGLAPG